MQSLAQDILAAAEDEEIIAISYRIHDLISFGSWESAKHSFEKMVCSGFGGPAPPPFYAWTKNKIIYLQEYDSATSVVAIPRNPDPMAIPHYG